MLAVLALALLSGTPTGLLRPAPEKIRAWTTALREQQPDDAFATIYHFRRRHLVFVAAQHENQNDSSTFKVIWAAYATFKFDTVIAEGFPASWGPNPARIIDGVSKVKPTASGFVEGGETVPAVLGAQQQGATLVGGEADDLDTKSRILAAGYSAKDLLGFYVLRNIPQWIEEHELDNAADSRLAVKVVAAIARRRQQLDLPADVLPSYAEWAKWYQELNHKPIGNSFQIEEVGPLADGPFGTNKIAYGVSKVRDAYLHELIIDRLNADKNVLVIFGGSHLLIQRPALDAVLGRPCYTGANLVEAAASCRRVRRR